MYIRTHLVYGNIAILAIIGLGTPIHDLGGGGHKVQFVQSANPVFKSDSQGDRDGRGAGRREEPMVEETPQESPNESAQPAIAS